MRETPIAREGFKFIIPSLFLALLFYIFFSYFLAFFSFFFFCFCLYFFRNPRRASTAPGDSLLSPADGTITEIKDMIEGEFLDVETRRVSIFMSLANVHVNRAPRPGRISRILHRRGEFALAWKKEIETVNERNYILIEKDDERILMVQIAGFLARRITCYVNPGDFVKRGDPVGIIAFGSRVDVYIPKSYECMVELKQKVKAGVTPLARKRGSL